MKTKPKLTFSCRAWLVACGLSVLSLAAHAQTFPVTLQLVGEPFFRAPGQEAPGHGLGLAIARKAAERHGGSLVLENHPQGGFVARLELPLAEATGS